MRVRGIDWTSGSAGKRVGVVDLTVEVELRRNSPRHRTGLHMTSRYAFGLAQDRRSAGQRGVVMVLGPEPVASASVFSR